VIAKKKKTGERRYLKSAEKRLEGRYKGKERFHGEWYPLRKFRRREGMDGKKA